jgi:hypothetical protein
MEPPVWILFVVLVMVVFNPLFPFVHIIFEYFFHPAHRQRRQHAKKEWKRATVDIPHRGTSREKTFWFEREVKYSIERDEFFLRNRRPYCNGVRWEPNWNEVTSDNIKQVIKRQL